MQSPATSAPVVLVIDDDVALLHSFESVLEAYGIPIMTARNGHDGLAVFRWILPAVVLTDIIMPEQDGISAIMAMRREHPATKIIAMSSGGRLSKSDFLTIAKKLGADAVVHKPFDVDELVKLLRTFLQAAGSQAA